MKKKLLLVTVLMLTTVLFAQSAQEGSETEEFYEYHENGNVLLKAFKKKNTKDGEFVLNGEFILYYEDGTKKMSGTLLNNKKDGYIFNYNEKGVIIDMEKYSLGVLNSRDTYYESGHLKKISNYENDLLNGLFREFYESGELKYQYYYKDNKHHGEGKDYYKNGNLQAKGNLIDGKLEGLWQYYYENGNLKKEVIYKNGEIVSEKKFEQERESNTVEYDNSSKLSTSFTTLLISDEEFNVIGNKINNLYNAIQRNDIDYQFFETKSELVNTLSKIVERYKKYLFEGDATYMYGQAAIYRGEYLDLVKEINENALKILKDLDRARAHFGNLQSGILHEVLVDNYNTALRRYNDRKIAYEKITQNMMDIALLYIKPDYNENDYPQNGKGTYKWESGNRYVGEFQNGSRTGYGVIFFSSGNVYAGEFKNGKKHGQGTFLWKEGHKFIGEYKDDKFYNGSYYYKWGAKNATYVNGIKE